MQAHVRGAERSANFASLTQSARKTRGKLCSNFHNSTREFESTRGSADPYRPSFIPKTFRPRSGIPNMTGVAVADPPQAPLDLFRVISGGAPAYFHLFLRGALSDLSRAHYTKLSSKHVAFEDRPQCDPRSLTDTHGGSLSVVSDGSLWDRKGSHTIQFHQRCRRVI